jgi:hypothetical protein
MSKRGSDEDGTDDEADNVATNLKKRLKIYSSDEEDTFENVTNDGTGAEEALSEVSCSALVLYRPLHPLPPPKTSADVAHLFRAKGPSQLAASKRESHLRLKMEELWAYPASEENGDIGEASEGSDFMDID